MTRQDMFAEIARASTMLGAARRRFPSDPALGDVEEALKWLAGRVAAQWPLSSGDREKIGIGQYAVRNLDDDFPDLVVQLVRVARLAKESGGSGAMQPPQV